MKPQRLDNDIAVVKILQLMGQLTPSDIKYVLSLCNKIHSHIELEDRIVKSHWVAGEPGSSDVNWESHLWEKMSFIWLVR